VVKVVAVSDPPDYEQPWQTLGASEATGSGAVVETADGLRILTNAHVVEHQVYVDVRRFGHAQRYECEVAGIGHECDLALLHVEDERFFGTVEPLRLGPLPALGDRVAALGFPIGGERLSVTEGVVSRIEMTGYAQTHRSLLAVQIDAAINEGNSGGPVLKSGAMVGVAFQALDEAENIGYVIPSPIVKRFLGDVADGVFDGFPALGIDTQNLESEAHRRSLGLPTTAQGRPGRQGILVVRTYFQGSAWQVLQPGDVLLEVGGKKLANDGTVRFRGGARIEYTHEIAMRQVGERLPLVVWRDGKRLALDVALTTYKPLVPESADLRHPRYFLYAGLVFVPLTHGLLQSWGGNWRAHAPPELVALYEGGIRTSARREVVLLQKVLADEVNRGYGDREVVPIAKLNGRGVRDLNDLARRVDRSTEPFLRFETIEGGQIVIDRARALDRQATILRRYGVPQDRSGVRGTAPSGRA
jgi:S1-C subfamily serine protease